MKVAATIGKGTIDPNVVDHSVIFGALVGEGTARGPLFWGYVLGSVVMLFGGLVAFKFGVDAEGKALEDIAPPLSTYDEHGNQLTKLPV